MLYLIQILLWCDLFWYSCICCICVNRMCMCSCTETSSKVEWALLVILSLSRDVDTELSKLPLYCFPRPHQINWFKVDDDVPSHAVITGSDLLIENLNKSYNGTYRCVASNLVGEAYDDYILYVYGMYIRCSLYMKQSTIIFSILYHHYYEAESFLFFSITINLSNSVICCTTAVMLKFPCQGRCRFLEQKGLGHFTCSEFSYLFLFFFFPLHAIRNSLRIPESYLREWRVIN